MLLTIALLLFAAWILGFAVFHVASVAIHVLIIIAVVSIVMHFVRGRRAGP